MKKKQEFQMAATKGVCSALSGFKVRERTHPCDTFSGQLLAVWATHLRGLNNKGSSALSAICEPIDKTKFKKGFHSALAVVLFGHMDLPAANAFSVQMGGPG